MAGMRVSVHPSTALVAAASGWILVLGINTWQFSLAVVALAWAVGTWHTRNASVIATTILLAAPAGLSMLLVHAPYGDHRLAPLLTLDGLVTAGTLTARFAALMAAFLAAAAHIHVTELAKALQVSPLGMRFAYVVTAALQLLPQAGRTVAQVRDANRLAGRCIHPGTVIPAVVVPVITHLLTANVEKSAALETAGLDLPGRRTLLRPVPDSRAQQVFRVLLPVLTVAGMLL
jgi:energy-coupling factor transport system permease protein